MKEEIPIVKLEDIQEEYKPIYNQWFYVVRIKILGTTWITWWDDDHKLTEEEQKDLLPYFQKAITMRFGGLMNGYKGEDIYQLHKHASAFFLAHPEYEIEIHDSTPQ